MDQPISAAEANRRFSRLLRGVRQGQSYVVTAHGEPVARIIPVAAAAAARRAARMALFRRLEAQPVGEIGRWRREDLYDAP